LPGVRALVEFLAERLPSAVERKHEQCCEPKKQGPRAEG
jgi:hypothetical protein